MNILEIVKQYAKITDVSLVHESVEHNCYLFPTHFHVEAFAEEISAKAVEEFKASLVPVACIYRNQYNEYRLEPVDGFEVTDLLKEVDVLLYALPVGETK